jgi:hypothetical protein
MARIAGWPLVPGLQGFVMLPLFLGAFLVSLFLELEGIIQRDRLNYAKFISIRNQDH